MKVIFWCEFPEKVNWKEARKLINFKTSIYVAAKSRKEYEKWEARIKSKNISTGAWPKLTEEEGYWFSGFLEKNLIDRLKDFDGLKLKIDIEPPFPGKGMVLSKVIFRYLIPYTIKKGRNNKYLENTIKELKSDVILSVFPFPAFITRKYGDVTELGKNMEKNFIAYTTLSSRMLARIYLRFFVRYAIKKYGDKAMFALGCTGNGILGDEGKYKSINQFKEDYELMKKLGVKKIVVFNVEGIMEREDRERWLGDIKKIIEL